MPTERVMAVLDAATAAVEDRDGSYGDPAEHFADVAVLWTAWFRASGRADTRFEPHDIPVMMAMLKMARTQGPGNKADNYIDGAGYIALAAEVSDG